MARAIWKLIDDNFNGCLWNWVSVVWRGQFTFYVTPRNGHWTNRGTDEPTIEYDICIGVLNTTLVHVSQMKLYLQFYYFFNMVYRLLPLSIYMTMNCTIVGDGATTAIRCCITCVYSLSISIAKQKKWKQKLKTTAVTCIECHILQFKRKLQRKLVDHVRFFTFGTEKPKKMKRNNHQCAVLTTRYEF